MRNRFVLTAAFAVVVCLIGCSDAPAPGSGAEIYTRYCATCHQDDGLGIERAFPPLAQTEWTLGDEGRLIRLVLFGMQGPIEVNGKPYNNAMTPHSFLTDEQVADVLTFVRSSFGNDAPAVSADNVAAIRAAEGDRGMYVSTELLTSTGIPGMEVAPDSVAVPSENATEDMPGEPTASPDE